MESIGNRLREARESQDLSIEDAAHQTRIQAIYIRGLENDDFSNFPSTTYAKSFLSLYSKFLEVDAADALEQFAGGDAISLSGQGYLESVTDDIHPRRPSSAYASRSSRPSAPRRSRSRETSPGMAPLFLGLILVALVIAIPTFWILGKDSDSMDDVVTKGKELTNAKFSTSEPKPEKVETDPARKEAPKTGDSGLPAAVPTPATPDQEPVKAQLSPPRETKMAQVTPPDNKRTLNNSPGVASPVVTGEKKPKLTTGDAALQAKPVAATPAGKKPEPESGSAPAVSTIQGEPLRAVPLIARPVIIPPEGSPSEGETPAVPESTSEETPEEEDEGAALRTDGNQFPRPLE